MTKNCCNFARVPKPNHLELSFLYFRSVELFARVFLHRFSKARNDVASFCRAARNEAKMTFKGVQSHLPRGTHFRERIPAQVKQNY